MKIPELPEEGVNYTKTVKENIFSNEKVEAIEMDELYLFVEKKQNLHNNLSEY